MPPSSPYRPAPRITTLSDAFYDVVEPARFPRHVLRFRNDRAGARVGLESLSTQEWEAHLARFEPLPGNLAQPLALRYHGHQFDSYNPQLGDGRGFLFAQTIDDEGRLLDLGTKGSGRTPWSRGGDGRLTLKGGVREVLATEMLEALGVATSKTLSLFETGEPLLRGDEPSPTRSSVLVRLSHSHVRFGTFQRLAFHDDKANMIKLVDYVLANLLPSCTTPVELFREVMVRSADLCASWMVAGFVHGVLNSDNMNVTGESFDYGPYRFLPHYDPAFVAAYFDHEGLYAFGRMPEAVMKNLARLGHALTLVASDHELASCLREYEPHLGESLRRRFLERLGVASVDVEEDAATIGAAFDLLEESRVGYDQFFFDWRGGAASVDRAQRSPAKDAYRGASFETFLRSLERHEPQRAAPPREPYLERATPCTLLIDEIEAIWSRIDGDDDWAPFEAKIAEIRTMGEALGPPRREANR